MVIQSFEGWVEEVHSDTFFVRLTSTLGEEVGAGFVAEVRRSALTQQDDKDLAEGVLIEWHITNERESKISIRRVPPLTEEEIKKGRELAEKWIHRFEDVADQFDRVHSDTLPFREAQW